MTEGLGRTLAAGWLTRVTLWRKCTNVRDGFCRLTTARMPERPPKVVVEPPPAVR